MRTETRTVRIGEKLGPIDWDYDFGAAGWDCGGAMNPTCIDPRVEMLRTLDEGLGRGEIWRATTDGGIPRVGWGDVRDIGMYDGWPYWRPTPSVWITSYLGGCWESWYMLSEIRQTAA